MENVSKRILEKGRKLVEGKKVVKDIENEKRMYFKVLGESEEHIVIYNKENKTYECDCSWNTLKHKKCSHIIASMILNKDHK